VRAYLQLFAHRDARWPLLTSMVARLTPGMMILALVLLLRAYDYSYAVAGLVSAAHQLGVGLASPVQGGLVDRYGQARVLVPDAVGYLGGTICLALAAAQGTGVPVLIIAGLLTGAFYPPVTASSRVLLSRLFPTGQLRETAFALASVSVELGFILGPLLAVWIAEIGSPAWSVVLAGMFAAVGSVGYASTAAARATPRRDGRRPRGGALRAPGVRVIALALAFAAVAFGVLDITVPAVAELAGDRSDAGRLIATLATGSLLAGIVYGGRMWPGTLPSRLRTFSMTLTLGFVLLPLTVHDPWLFAAGLFLVGMALAPTMICAFQLLDDLAIRGTQTEAQSWLQSAVVLGVALGASSAGFAVDAGGPWLAFVVGAVGIGVGASVVHRRQAVLSVVAREAPGLVGDGGSPSR
jgi:MFS family permease